MLGSEGSKGPRDEKEAAGLAPEKCGSGLAAHLGKRERSDCRLARFLDDQPTGLRSLHSEKSWILVQLCSVRCLGSQESGDRASGHLEG